MSITFLDTFQDKITFPSTFDDIILIDNMGNTHKFGGINFKERGDEDYTAWVLNEIKTSKNKKIGFKYQVNLIEELYGKKSEFRIFPATEIIGTYEPVIFTNEFYYEDNMSKPNLEACFITQISTDNETIEFIRSNEGEQPYLLKEIIIKNISGKFLKKIIINKETSGEHNLLSNIEILDENSVQVGKYSFNYYDKPKYSTYSDQWGYYKMLSVNRDMTKDMVFHSDFENDEILSVRHYASNNILSQYKIFRELPHVYKNISENNNKGYFIHLLDRSTSEKNPCYFSLKSITFPSGGKEEYEYESHQYKIGSNVYNGEGLRISKIISRNQSTTEDIISIFKYGENENGLSIVDSNLKNYSNLFRSEIYDYLYYQYTHDPVFKRGKTHMRVTPTRIYSSHPSGEDGPFNLFQYKEVSIYSTGKESNGKTILKYIPSDVYETDVNTSNIQFGYKDVTKYTNTYYIKKYNPGFESKIQYKIQINSDNDTVKLEEYKYKDIQKQFFEYLKVKQLIFPSADYNNRYSEFLFTNLNHGIYEYASSLF